MLCQSTTGLRSVTRMTYGTLWSCRYMDIHQSGVFKTDMKVAPSAVPEQGSTQRLYN
jgi:hypothetical protein